MAKLLISLFLAISMIGTIQASKIVELCEKPASEGNVYCISEGPRWTFNSEDEKCVDAGHYAGCSQTGNNFGSEQDCLIACGEYKNEATKRKKTYPDACFLPSGKPGMCRAAIRSYFFDSKTSECKQFTYGGCGGNANRFGDINDCEKYCPVKGKN